jgi:predicted hydrocarbon binding protein
MAAEPEKTVTNIAIRAAYDSVGEILGARARDMILKNAGLSRVIESTPEYTWDKGFTNAEQLSLYVEVVNLVGAVGAQGVLRQIGYKNAETSVLKFGVLNHLADLPSHEKITKCFEFFRVVINKGRAVSDDEGMPKFDVFDCLMCGGITSKKPYCSQYAGALSFFTDWTFGKGIYIVKETRCKVLGDDTCLFEIDKRP